MTWRSLGLPYLLRNAWITFAAGARLTLSPGTVVKLGNSNVTLQGGLNAAGTPDRPVIFTSLNDDSVGGPVSGSSGSPAPGNWGSIILDASSATLANVKLRYGGSTYGAILYVYNGGGISFIGGELDHSANSGIYVDYNSSFNLANISVSNNNTGIASDSSLPDVIYNCSITSNTNAGLYHSAAQPVQANYNWWGSTTGPTNAANPGGTGDVVSGNVDFLPFLQQPPTLAPPTALPLVLLDPSPTQSKSVRFQLSFSQPLDTSVQPVVTYGQNAPDGAYSIRIAEAKDLSHQSMLVSTQPFYTVDNTAPQLALSGPAAGATLSRPLTIEASASDANGIARVVFQLDGVAQATMTAAPYSFFWDTRAFPDGQHVLAVQAEDGAGNRTSLSRSVVISYAPPSAPDITYPYSGFATNLPAINVTGTAEPGTTVQLMVNGLDLATAAVVNGFWQVWSATLPGEGPITLTAVAFESRGFSGPSAPVMGVYSGTAPNAPILPQAAVQAGGAVKLSWSSGGGKTSAYYRVYRSLNDQDLVPDEPAPADLLIAGNVTAAEYTDWPGADDLYFYAMTSVDGAGNESLLSDVVYALTDRTPPSAAVALTAGSVLGPGAYPLALTVSEALAQPPLLTFAPNHASPAPVNLEAMTARLWRGTLTVTSDMLPGPAAFAFEGRDLAGNVGSVSTAPVISLDTRGPIGGMLLSKPSPLGPGALGMSLSLDKPAAAAPALRIILANGQALDLTVAQAGSDRRNWTSSMAITASLAQGQAAISYSAVDDLGNVGTLLGGATYFIVDTVPPGEPVAVRANEGPGGTVVLSWSAPWGEAPASYRVFCDGAAIASAWPRPDLTGTYTDTPSEGLHQYAVSALDAAGNEGPASDPPATADATPPAAPSGLSASLDAYGQIVLIWTAGDAHTAGYRLYRSTQPINTLSGLPYRQAVSPFP
ncbi:MAG: Ig-like domain-containing protein, partial [Elusimicrobiota bacterium]